MCLFAHSVVCSRYESQSSLNCGQFSSTSYDTHPIFIHLLAELNHNNLTQLPRFCVSILPITNNHNNNDKLVQTNCPEWNTQIVYYECNNEWQNWRHPFEQRPSPICRALCSFGQRQHCNRNLKLRYVDHRRLFDESRTTQSALFLAFCAITI